MIIERQITVEREIRLHVQHVTWMRGNKRRNLENKHASAAPPMTKRIANYHETLVVIDTY